MNSTYRLQFNILGAIDIVDIKGPGTKIVERDRYTPVTCWYRLDKERQEFTYNHYEIGWKTHDKPKPTNDTQIVWDNMKWQGRFKYYDNKDNKIYDEIDPRTEG